MESKIRTPMNVDHDAQRIQNAAVDRTIARLDERAKEAKRRRRGRRPDLCPNCGHSVTSHTGSYCQDCGEVL